MQKISPENFFGYQEVVINKPEMISLRCDVNDHVNSCQIMIMSKSVQLRTDLVIIEGIRILTLI